MESKKENPNMRYFITLRCEGRFPSGFESDTWEITEPVYNALQDTVKIFERGGVHANSTIRNSQRSVPLYTPRSEKQ